MKIDDRRFYQVDTLIERTLIDWGQDYLVHYMRINNNWKVIIGDALFEKTFPRKLEKGTLTILVADAAYAYHLRYFKSKILDLIASPEICGENIVRDIRYVTGPLPRWKVIADKSIIKPKSVKQKKSRTSFLSQKTASKIQDSDLKIKFSRLMHTMSSRQSQQE